MATADLLLELGCEELPPSLLKPLSEALVTSLETGLKEAGIPFTATKVYATPRRLAVLVKALDSHQPDQAIERRGPALAAAYKDGEPSKAALGFAASCGVELASLETLETDKGSWLDRKSVV